MALPNPLYALVTDVKCRPTKTPGRYFNQSSLRTTHGEIKALMWDAPPPHEMDQNPSFPHVGDILQIHNFKDELEEFHSIKINAGGFVRVTINELPPDQRKIAEAPKASPEDMAWAKKVLFDASIWREPIHFDFVKRCLTCFDKEMLMKAPAASHVHHVFVGGLIIHTSEVLELCQVIAATMLRKYNFIDTDVLYAAAILHDIGKVATYKINAVGFAESMVNEKVIGHIFYGMEVVQRIGREMQGQIGQDFVDEVCHAVACHHGLLEWGSVKEVQSIEGGILSRADYISSRNGMLSKKLEEYLEYKNVEDSFKLYGDNYFASRGIKGYVGEPAQGAADG